MLLVVDVKTVNTSLCLGVCDGVVFVASSVSLSPKTICLVYSPLLVFMDNKTCVRVTNTTGCICLSVWVATDCRVILGGCGKCEALSL